MRGEGFLIGIELTAPVAAAVAARALEAGFIVNAVHPDDHPPRAAVPAHAGAGRQFVDFLAVRDLSSRPTPCSRDGADLS